MPTEPEKERDNEAIGVHMGILNHRLDQYRKHLEYLQDQRKQLDSFIEGALYDVLAVRRELLELEREIKG